MWVSTTVTPHISNESFIFTVDCVLRTRSSDQAQKLVFRPQAIVKPPEEKREFASDKQTQFLVSDTPSGTSSGAIFGKDVNRETLSNRENTVNISQVAEPDPTY